MSTKKRSKSSSQPAPSTLSSHSSLPSLPRLNGGQTLVLENDVPIQGIFGRSPAITYRKEWELIDGMAVGQCVGFKTKEMLSIVNSIRTKIQDSSPKKFVLKKVDATYSRLWRVDDGTILLRRKKGTRQKRNKTEMQISNESQN